MPERFIYGLLIAWVLCPEAAAAQGWRCGGHTSDWVGGAPVAGFGREPAGDHDSTNDGSAQRLGPAHEDGTQPSVPEPSGLNRERWDELVFNALDQPGTSPPFIEPLGQRQTQVIERDRVPAISLCIQSPETSDTGTRLEPYANRAWWRRQIERWTGLNWNGELQIGACTGEVPEGWIYVREADADHFSGPGVLAAALSRREPHPHGRGRWLASDLVWNPDALQDTDEEYFETSVAHELGHALGFSHVAPGTGYAMVVGITTTWPQEESDLAQLAYRVGPNIRYPGVMREDAGDGDPDHPDRPALTALYEGTGGEHWADSTNWDSTEPLDRWYGVTTDAEGRVTEIELHVNNLSGKIPPELDGLAHLEHLALEENSLTGVIPTDLAELSNLEYLHLEDNALSGTIPAEFADLSNLTGLNLAVNNLTGTVPAALGQLSGLKSLRLQLNELTGTIPPALGDLSNLVELGLSFNNLDGTIPAELGNLSSLVLLGLHDNRLTGPIPPELGNLSRVWTLYLSSNDLTGTVPPELGRMSSLSELDLGENDLTGPLPAALTDLRGLQLLDISNNAGLCAPTDDAFQDWLATVAEFRGLMCAAEPVPVLPVGALSAGLLLLGGLGAGVIRRRGTRRPDR